MRARRSVGVTLTPSELAAPLARYAERFHAELGDGHHVASPLGACLLLALAASVARGDKRGQLVEVLGVDLNEAVATARALLSDPHPLVGAAAAVWHRPEVITDGSTRGYALPGRQAHQLHRRELEVDVVVERSRVRDARRADNGPLVNSITG
jgi:hypothetical protein